MTADPAPNRRTFAWLVLGTAAFTVYGSLVPFEFRLRTWDDASGSFLWAMENRALFESRSDALANLLLGVPLGFGLMGLMFVEQRENRAREIVLGLIVLPGCLGFAAIVEFLQLFFPLRTCAGSDVICQGIGAAIGMAAWIARGRWLVGHARAFWSGSDSASRALVAYLVLLAVIQTLPLDLNPSPKDVYKKLRDEARWIPFGEFFDSTSGSAWDHAAKLARTFGLFLPVGLLLGPRPSRPHDLPGGGADARFRKSPVRERLAAGTAAVPGGILFLLAFAIPVGMEGIQVFVRSRVPSASDAAAGTLAVLAGAMLVGKAHPLRRVGILGWIALLLLIWGPFPFHERHPHAAFDWMPGLPLESGNPLFALEEMLVKLVLFGLGGTLVVLGEPRTRMIAAAILGAVVSGGLEALQTMFGSHSPSITDVILGGLGGCCGAEMASRVLTSPTRQRGF